MDEVILCESKTLRQEYCTDKNTDLLDRVGQIIELPGTAWATIENIAKFYMVGIETAKSTVKRHRDELKSDGYKLLTRKDFEKVHDAPFEIPNRGITVFPRRAVLRIGMILRDSPVAKLLRSYLLDIEQSINNDGTLLQMANQLTQHSIQISKNVEELRELAQASIDQSRMISAVVTEIYKNKDEIQQVRNVVKQHSCHMTLLDNRVDAIEKNLILTTSQNYISQQQVQELKYKVRSKQQPAVTIWARFRRYFQIDRYIHLPQERFAEALLWVDSNF